MASKYWVGGADVTAQVATVQITAYDAATTYTITIGGSSVSVAGTTDANGTATALEAALEAKKTAGHPYFAALDYSVATDTVTITAGTAGVPFVASSSVAGGTGTIGAVTETAANAGPTSFSTAENWSDGAVPVSSDTIYFADSDVNCVWNLDQSALTGLTLYIDQSYTGLIGLDRRSFATSVDGETTDTTIADYRQAYLDADCSRVEIGRELTAQSFAGSSRIKVSNSRGSASTNIIHKSGTSSGPPAVMLLTAHASANIEIREAQGGVGIGTDTPTETGTAGTIEVSGSDSGTAVSIGPGMTYTNLKVNDGSVFARAAATVTAVTLNGGELTMEGEQDVTTANLYGGTFLHNGALDITTVNLDGALYDASPTNTARTVTTFNYTSGSFRGDPELTITTFNEPTRGTLTFNLSV